MFWICLLVDVCADWVVYYLHLEFLFWFSVLLALFLGWLISFDYVWIWGDCLWFWGCWLLRLLFVAGVGCDSLMGFCLVWDICLFRLSGVVCLGFVVWVFWVYALVFKWLYVDCVDYMFVFWICYRFWVCLCLLCGWVGLVLVVSLLFELVAWA